MNLLTKGEFAKLVGVSAPAISKALRKDSSGNSRLECYRGTEKIDVDCPLSQAFINNISRQRQTNVPSIPNGSDENLRVTTNENLSDAVTKVQLAQAQKIIEEAEFKKQQRVEKELKNAVRRGELIEVKIIKESVMMFIDRWLNTNKRVFSSFFDEMQNKILAQGEKCPELKREFQNKMEEAAREAKEITCQKLEEIQIKQGER